ncbi:PepSY-associated TM helix domain-containing protein [Hyalangium rubrum]|uniref:PepSY-associated TM helix domain-containing protein n=1 Tax=Hyalangium rubrum TaxID=3103134 RepID=A0ABU5GXQ4_9BACT|nr:PepSY-associated TM helix domain-containing protein [Hyalangium sp. s54d21]MDY7225479.1 PepSY-associated TM helix domain-containing protein [Hyalangium sp. s54d21]
MKSTFRSILFWMHLVSGLVAGIIIGIMSLTGAALAFAPQLTQWADSDARRVQAPAPDAPRLPIDELVARVRAARPEAQPSGVTVYPDPMSAVQVSTGRDSGVYVNPYTGEVRELGALGLRSFFHVMEEWHRWLGTRDDNRAVGKAITGVCNAAFLFLALSGLYLWWPRKWTRKTLRPVVWFKGGLKGKARDFNWHNVAGFWTMPVLVVLTASGVVMSYKGVSDLIFTLTGNEPPASGGPSAQATVKVPEPPAGATQRSLDALFAEAQKQVPAWESITLRMGGGPRAGGARGPQAGGPGGGPQAGGPGGPGGNEARGGGGRQATNFSVKEQGAWPLFASVQFSLDPFTGQVLRQETFADYNTGRKIRTWLRFLHTGQALGWVGQLVAGVASLAGAFLMWTGFTLSWRRFFRRRSTTGASPEPSTPEPGTTPVQSETSA